MSLSRRESSDPAEPLGGVGSTEGALGPSGAPPDSRLDGAQAPAPEPVSAEGSVEARPAPAVLRRTLEVPPGEDEHSFVLRLLDTIAWDLSSGRDPRILPSKAQVGTTAPYRTSGLRSDGRAVPPAAPAPVAGVRRPQLRLGMVPETAAPGQAEPTSPYLEERLVLATASAESLSRELQTLGDRWDRLERSAEVIERELGNAAREIRFLQGRPPGPLGPETPPAERPRRRSAPASAVASTPGAPSIAPPQPFGAFTIDRYNATVGGLKSRRRSLQLGTLALGAAISLALVALALLAKEPFPAAWLALLPVIWMIPVPFFVLSFLGTHRVLRRNHLNLVGGP